MSDEEVKKIYSQVLIKRDQAHQKLEDMMYKTTGSRLIHLFSNYYRLLHDPKISAEKMDQAKREMSKFLDNITMHTDHEVIMVLTNNLITQKYQEKIFNAK